LGPQIEGLNPNPVPDPSRAEDDPDSRTVEGQNVKCLRATGGHKSFLDFIGDGHFELHYLWSQGPMPQITLERNLLAGTIS
jgi:hypothetical protein